MQLLEQRGWRDLGNGSSVGYFPGELSAQAAALMADLVADASLWLQRDVMLFGRAVPQPRLVCYMADGPQLKYTYSGQTLEPLEWREGVLHLKQHLEQLLGSPFNSCLLNYYRDGRDNMGWHSDDEPLYGERPTIASVSLGSPRDFDLRLIADRSCKLRARLGGGDVLVMRGAMQQEWQHCVPRRSGNDIGPRINLTFRLIVHPERQAHARGNAGRGGACGGNSGGDRRGVAQS